MQAPGGTPHRFENVGATPSTLLIVVEPSVLDFLREVGTAFPPGSPPDMERMLDLSAKHQIDVFYDGDGARPEPPRDGATSAQARSACLALQPGEQRTHHGDRAMHARTMAGDLQRHRLERGSAGTSRC